MSNFLDDILYEHIKNNVSVATENAHDVKLLKTDLQNLVNELYVLCETHWKPQIMPNMSYGQVKVVIDRTFNAWNLLVIRLRKENHFLTDLIDHASYEKAYLSNQKLKEIYEHK